MYFTADFIPHSFNLLTEQSCLCIIITVKGKQQQEVIILKVSVKIKEEIKEPYAVIFTNIITADVQRAVLLLDSKSEFVTASNNEKIVLLEPNEIFMVRVENSETVIYCQDRQYISKRRLYEILTQLGRDFMQISKSTIVNLKKIDCVEPSISGMMRLCLKNGQSDYISRKYLPEFKRYLGL